MGGEFPYQNKKCELGCEFVGLGRGFRFHGFMEAHFLNVCYARVKVRLVSMVSGTYIFDFGSK